MGMYPVSVTPMDSQLWQLIAFCAGTGGSMLVIGSAAGVALMGLEKVDFVWYAKKISLAATVGYLAGIVTYLIQTGLFSQWVTSILPAAATAASIDVLTTAATIVDTTATVSSTVISTSLNLAQVELIDSTIVATTVTATSDFVTHLITNLDLNHILTIISSFFY